MFPDSDSDSSDSSSNSENSSSASSSNSSSSSSDSESSPSPSPTPANNNRPSRSDVYKYALEQPDLYGIRRSTRTKRDSEPHELVQQPQRRKRRYSSSDDSDYSGSDDQNSFRKGRYSDAKRKPARKGGKVVSYREASDDDQTGSDDLIECQYEVETDNGYDTIEKVMTHRFGKLGATGVKTVIYSEERDLNPIGSDKEREKQYLIKWKNWSHIHNTWESRQSLIEQKANNLKRLELYEKKEEEIRLWKDIASIEDAEYFECQLEMMMELQDQYTQVERIVCERAITGDRFRDKSDDYDQPYTSKYEYFVKWCNLPYSECSWEDANLIKRMFPLAVIQFESRKHLALPSFKEIRTWHARAQFRRITEQPSFIASGDSSLKLRDYQLDGLNWLIHAWVKRHGCILADEMGLGKTIQTISLLNVLLKIYNVAGPYLLVVPLSTIMTWQKEFATWAPDMNVLVYLGDQKSRETVRNYEWQHASTRKWKFNALITTYELLSKDKQELGVVQWAVLAVDEAHRLKNDDCQLYKILSSFSTDHRLLITGTPLQNSLRELWSLLHFIMPVKFDDWGEFEEKYSDDSNFFALHRRLEPFLLRRVKKDVEKSLPSKTEQILRVAMTSKQKQYYKWILTKNYEALSKGVKGSITGFINIVMELKKCCNHPYLVRQPDEGMSRESLEAFIKSSGKLILLDKLLLRLKEGGHRVLIFSQMVMMLDILAEYLQRRRFAFQRLDGSIKSEQRRQSMDHFNAEGSPDFCFLLSTRAGGLGVNLATADTVIIFDSDWNPQNDLQAQARAHRIGQKKQVSVYRLVTKGSVEEDILERAKKKMVLDHLVIQSMDTTGRAVLNNKQRRENNPFNKDELSAILKFGAEDLFKEDEDEDDVELDDILRRAETHTTEDHSSNADGLLSQFKVVNFDNLEHEEIEQRHWDSIIPESERKKYNEEEREKEIRKLNLGPRSRKNISYKEGKKRDDSASAASDDDITPKKKRGRKFPRPLERLEDIAADGDLKQKNIGDLRKLGERLLEECRDAMTQYDERIKYDPTTENKKTHKGPTITLGSISVKAKQILTAINELEPLAKVIPTNPLEHKKFKLETKTKAAHWECDWDVTDDSTLLLGIYKKGLGNWEAIKHDSELGLGNKILPEGDKKPQAKHLQARFEYLSKILTKMLENAAHGQPEPKAKKKKKINKINKPLKIIVKKEEEKVIPVETHESVPETNKEKIKEAEESQDDGINELTEEEFKECKEKMRPVKKALKRLDNSEDQSDLSTAEKVYRAQQLLLEIGDHINEVLKKRSDPDRIKRLRANLWKFVSKFTDKHPTKLYKMYKHSIKRRREREQHNGKSEKSRMAENPISSPSYNQQKSAYSRPPEFKHKPSGWSGKSSQERWHRSSHSSNYKERNATYKTIPAITAKKRRDEHLHLGTTVDDCLVQLEIL